MDESPSVEACLGPQFETVEIRSDENDILINE